MLMRYFLFGVFVSAILSGVSSGFSHLASNSRRLSTSESPLFGDVARSDDTIRANDAVDDALIFLNEARKLRAQANELQLQLDREKEERIRKQRDKVDSLIDALLFHGMNNNASQGPTGDETRLRSKQQLLHTEEQVANLLISKRMNYDLVNQMFDRICELSNRPQSVDSCSPLLSLLLDAACKVDCLEREENPNKRWNHRVERDLRKKLFLLGYGIRIEEVNNTNNARSITGEKDYL